MASLFYDLGSPYAYMSVMRLERVFREPPRLQPVLAGAIFKHRGRPSWGLTDERAANQAEIERRAASYGLPPVTWPPNWPPNTLSAMRACVWAGDDFARAAYHAAFAEGADLGDVAVVRQIASSIGLSPSDLDAAIADDIIKSTLRAETDRAIALGVTGVPTLLTDDDHLIFGDDRLAEAA